MMITAAGAATAAAAALVTASTSRRKGRRKDRERPAPVLGLQQHPQGPAGVYQVR